MPAKKERVYRVPELFALGLDVVLVQLPFHAQRRDPARRMPAFPSENPQLTVQGFGQAVHDVRALIGWLRRRGAPAVGLTGMSLGGYTASLVATAEPGLAFLVPFIPLADLTAVKAEHEALRERRVPAELLELGRQALLPVSPLARTPLVAPEKCLVLAARHDRITGGATHAARLAAWLRCRLVWFEGAHLVQLDRRAAFAGLEALLRSQDLL